VWRGSVSPHSGGTVPDLHRIPLPLAGLSRETSIGPPMATRSRLLTVWLPVLAWAAVIFAFSSIPHLSSGLGVWDTVLRKGAHITEYAILGALLYRALEREALALAVGIAYAATDELHQHFVRGRHASPIDVAIDAVGLSLGMLVWLNVRER
jgi:VanZ family protein